MQSDMLDVVIGVVFVWFLLSGLLSVVNEGFSLVTHARAKHLWLGIGRLIDPQRSPLPRRLWDITVRLPFSGRLDLRPRAEVAGPPPAAAAGKPVGQPVGRWWQQQTARMTERPGTKTPELADLRSDLQTVYVAMAPQLVEVAKPGRLSKLSNIPAAAVSEALTRWVSPVHRAELVGAARRLQWSGEDRAKLEALLADVGDDEVVELDDLLDRDGAGLSESALRAVHDEATVRLGLADLTGRLQANPELAAALRRAVATAQGHERVIAARRVVEQWFDHEMAQLTVFYRRQARKVMALLAVPVVVLFHANAIALVQDLHDDAVLRQAVVNEAVTAGAAESLDEAVRQSCSTAAPEGADDEDPVAAATDQLACARRIVDDAAPLSVGLAWDDLKAAHGDPDRLEVGDVWPYLWDDWGLVGRGLTLVALLFGAQFWFDVLRRLVGIRRPAPASPAPTA